MNEEIKPLSKKHQKFIDEWLQCFNGTEAYSRTYPKANRDSARANAAELLAKPSIKKEIEDRLAEAHMSADEALKLQADIARGDITDLLTPLGSIDLDFIREKGLGRLIKKIKTRTITKIGKGDKDDDTEIHDTELEMYPADAAQERILKVGGKITDRVDVTSGGEPLTPKEDDGRFDRAIESLANALREVLPNKGDGENSKVDTSK